MSSVMSRSGGQDRLGAQKVASTPKVGEDSDHSDSHPPSPIHTNRADVVEITPHASGNRQEADRRPGVVELEAHNSRSAPAGNHVVLQPGASHNNEHREARMVNVPVGALESVERAVVAQVGDLLVPVLSRLESLEIRLGNGVAAPRNDRPGPSTYVDSSVRVQSSMSRPLHAAVDRNVEDVQRDRRIRFDQSIASGEQSSGRFGQPVGSSSIGGAFVQVPSYLHQTAASNGVPSQGGSSKSQHLKTSDIKIPTYSGAHEARTPYEFLMDLERYRKAVGYTEVDMLAQVIPLALREDAELWYRKVQYSVGTWQEFQVRFRREFQSPTYVRKLRRELEDRFQGPHEPLTKFIYVIDDYFQRLDPATPQKVRADRIIQNMHPDYRRKILTVRREFNSVEEIMSEAYEAQASLAWDREYKVPDIKGSIEPTLAYRHPQWVSRPEPVASIQYQRPNAPNIPEIQPSSFDRYAYFHSQGIMNRGQVRFERNDAPERGNENRPRSPFHQSRPGDNPNNRAVSPRPFQYSTGNRPMTPPAGAVQADRNGNRPPTPYNATTNNRPVSPSHHNSRPVSPAPAQGSRPASPGGSASQGNGQCPSRA